MKQVTGKINSSSAANKVSIQLALDGHSFSLTGGMQAGEQPAEASSASVAGADAVAVPLTVEIVTPRTLLVPEAFFMPERAALLLTADGKAPLEGETTVWSVPSDEVVAVMAVPEAALAQLPATERTYTTPLLHPLHPDKPTLRLEPVGPYLYIKCWHAGLRLAEVLPAPTDTDIRYATERLESEFSAKQYALRIAGPRAGALVKLLGHLYPDTRCE